MWGVRPVEVKEAAARPVVWEAVGAVEEGGLGFLERVGGGAGFLGLGRTSAPLPRAERLTLRLGSLRSRSCAGVSVLVPSLRYLKALRLRPERFCGSCNVIMSFLLNSASLTRSRHIFALMFRRSTVSQAKTLPVLARATMCVLFVKTL